MFPIVDFASSLSQQLANVYEITIYDYTSLSTNSIGLLGISQ